MCGIAAIFAYAAAAPPVDGAELARMSQAMLSRGPDGDGSWTADDGRIGLAHRRLSIIDLSAAAAQPMSLEGGDGRITARITYNGEIYNFRALRSELEARGRRFQTQSDTEVLLHLYDEHGPEMVAKLRGMFALAIWDEAKRGLLLARDPFGIKPLYYADDGKTLRIASQVKALRAGGVAGQGIDAAGHVGFFLFGHVPDPHTLYQDIRALPAGSTLWIDGGGKRLDTYFELTSELAASGGSAGGLRDSLLDSIDHHLVADVPVGVFLSAGLDSAAVTGLAAERHQGAIRTMTLGFEEFRGSPRDETGPAGRIAETYATEHRTEWVRGSDFRGDLEAVLEAMDQPTIDGVNVYFVARAAAGLGLKVALSGLGGDELLGGYNTFDQVPRLVKGLGWIPGGRCLGTGLRMMSAPWLKHMASPKAAGLLELGTTYGDAYLLRRGLFMPWELTDVLDADLVRDGWRDLKPSLRLGAVADPVDGPRHKVGALEMSFYMKNQLLRDADWAGMAHSLEIRVPLVDAWLLKALAPSLYRPGGPDKQALARTPATALPDDIAVRPKTGFSIPVRDWLQGGGGGQAPGKEAQAPGNERGLRGWARQVYAAQTAA